MSPPLSKRVRGADSLYRTLLSKTYRARRFGMVVKFSSCIGANKAGREVSWPNVFSFCHSCAWFFRPVFHAERVSEEEEFEGLNITDHGEVGYDL